VTANECIEFPAADPVIDGLIERYLAHEGVLLAACTVLWKRPSPYLTRIQSGEALLAIKEPDRRAEVEPEVRNPRIPRGSDGPAR
jgi:hypothetical protein